MLPAVFPAPWRPAAAFLSASVRELTSTGPLVTLINPNERLARSKISKGQYMPKTDVITSLPGKAVPYILRQGEVPISTLRRPGRSRAGWVDETAGGYGAVVCEATIDRQPIPLHYQREGARHLFCTRGRLRIWQMACRDVLTDGDFAYSNLTMCIPISLWRSTPNFSHCRPRRLGSFLRKRRCGLELPGLPPKTIPSTSRVWARPWGNSA